MATMGVGAGAWALLTCWTDGREQLILASSHDVSHGIILSGFQGLQSMGPFCFHESRAET